MITRSTHQMSSRAMKQIVPGKSKPAKRKAAKSKRKYGY